MASVTSLGLHRPTGLQYAVREGLLAQDPAPSSYTWHNHANNHTGSPAHDDELLVTERCVIWSRGGVFRRSFKFDLENEPVTQAILTTFPSDGPIVSRDSNTRKTAANSSRASPAIVVVLKTQAHIYFLSGTSHAIHLPFEVESVSATPSGILIQRKLRLDKSVPASLTIPRVPPNSFVSSQPQTWSAASSLQSTFSVADLGDPKQMPMLPNPTMRDLWDVPSLKRDSNWPRLFSLSDPLAEVGLVVAQPITPDSHGTQKKRKTMSLDPAEEMLYITRPNEFAELLGEQNLVLVVTLNRQTSMYTVWRLSYLGPEKGTFGKQRVSSGNTNRRRSSFVPGTRTGATTPVSKSQQNFRDSLGGNSIAVVKKGALAENTSKDNATDYVSSLDTDFENPANSKRKSRRVSSMLARAELSASHERTVFAELAHQGSTTRRGESLGGHHTRTSAGVFPAVGGQSSTQPQFNHSINSLIEAPVDDLLDELRAGGDFEGFHNMGLDDEEFDALRQEVVLSKIHSLPVEHSTIRYSSQHSPAKSQCRIFTLSSPPSSMSDQANKIDVCILDPDEHKLIALTLLLDVTRSTHTNQHGLLTGPIQSSQDVAVVSSGSVTKIQGVIDACPIDDGTASRILVLMEMPEGHRELSLQARWSPVVRISLPGDFAMSNIRGLSYDTSPRARREGGFKRVLSQGARTLCGMRNTKPQGLVDLLDDEGKLHQVQIQLQPRNPHVLNAIETCLAVLPGSTNGQGILVAWWNVMNWLRVEAVETKDQEWSALVITLFMLAIGTSSPPKPLQSKTHTKRKSQPGNLRSSSGVNTENQDWERMQAQEASSGTSPSWASNSGWKWLEENIGDVGVGNGSQLPSVTFSKSCAETGAFIKQHIQLARTFLWTKTGQSVVLGCLPSSSKERVESRGTVLIDVLVALHLLREEQKLNIMTTDSFGAGTFSLTPILAQIARWLGWESWTTFYDTEDASLFEVSYETNILPDLKITEPFACPSVYDWIQSCLVSRSNDHTFLTISDLAKMRSGDDYQGNAQSLKVTPRTLLFTRIFASMRDSWSAADFVETLSAAGMDVVLLETLPEAILAPLQEAIVQCQTEPPTQWSKKLLAIVGRDDVNVLLTPGQRPRHAQSTLLVRSPDSLHVSIYSSRKAPSHESNLDIHTICISTFDIETAGSFDGSAEVERSAVTRAIFKEDRRVNEAMNILNTFRPTVAHCKSQPLWTESELLEAQKEHAQMLAYRTLAIPSGRGMLNFSARIPILTQRFAIGGFNLSCVMKPDNNTVGVDKNSFTEEKVCWAFFHSGVSAGLSISRDARGIDTSWILYNKPLQDLSNRHAGFLLALGLNGHLKSVAKWVAFKYLTPKHTMTSIGLLLGLAASYIGTMDSLITRLLSVHVTRMLPPGAAELNLSPLTQTTGIMGIGLLYCNTQHRRMSEIMVSEIEHIDTETDEEPLRNEGYRLAAGFALGLINLGKGLDLRGLHDMRLTERLLALAAGSKKVSLVHVLDKATPAAVVAIALIFMKSENQVLARKIDVPDSVLQFDYIRPDVFLLRTLARHLIMWTKIVPSFEWIEQSLPPAYRSKSKLENINVLTTVDLPFYDILAGLCFSVALRYAGSASPVAKDLLIHYLDQFMRICRIEANTYDKKLTRNTVRNCQDLIALAAATVMAGTGDLSVFRRLRSMHGRDDNETPYGSHLAAHLAIGALFLGGGTFTFSTSDLSVAALLIAFYPIFPSTVQDNKSHLQAFRHFWVLAAEPRCLISRDIDTNQPVSIPITVLLRNGDEFKRHTPCLLPELNRIKIVRTNSPEYWNIALDLETNQIHIESFKSTQTIYVRRRPAHEASTTPFQATLQALNDIDGTTSQSLEWLFELPVFATLTKAERALVLPPDRGGASDLHAGTEETVVDARLVLENATVDSEKKDRLLGLRLLFEWADKKTAEGMELQWIRREVVERLKARVWIMAKDED